MEKSERTLAKYYSQLGLGFIWGFLSLSMVIPCLKLLSLLGREPRLS